MTLGREPRVFLFGAYAGLLFMLTHWPRMKIDAPIPRPDLAAHMAAFVLWTVLMAWSAWFGPPRSARNALTSAGLAAGYAALDEGLQAIPFLHRVAAWEDFAFDLLGVGAGLLVLAAASRLASGQGNTSRVAASR